MRPKSAGGLKGMAVLKNGPKTNQDTFCKFASTRARPIGGYDGCCIHTHGVRGNFIKSRMAREARWLSFHKIANSEGSEGEFYFIKSRMGREARVMPKIAVMCMKAPLTETLLKVMAPELSVSAAASGWFLTSSSE